eukprot:scaffold233853_cov30-Tisochrysis_lutea.AAC.1
MELQGSRVHTGASFHPPRLASAPPPPTTASDALWRTGHRNSNVLGAGAEARFTTGSGGGGGGSSGATVSASRRRSLSGHLRLAPRLASPTDHRAQDGDVRREEKLHRSARAPLHLPLVVDTHYSNAVH